MKHILSVDQFSEDDLEYLCDRADFHAYNVNNGSFHALSLASGRILSNLFYQPSTRTSSSFHAAMLRLGGSVIQTNNVQYSSVAKGETLEDTIRTMQCYTDVIVLRHPEIGASHRAAAVASVPIINAGDGQGEHPTQALLDFYTIKSELGPINGLHVVLMGDLLHGRTVKSLAKLLRKYQVRITWVSPYELRIPPAYLAPGDIQTDDLFGVIEQADVLYVTRVQQEYVAVGVDQSKWVYGVSKQHMELAKKTMLLMHPLPRLAELPVGLDDDPRSAYFRQMRHGLFMRMAVLADVLNL